MSWLIILIGFYWVKHFNLEWLYINNSDALKNYTSIVVDWFAGGGSRCISALCLFKSFIAICIYTRRFFRHLPHLYFPHFHQFCPLDTPRHHRQLPAPGWLLPGWQIRAYLPFPTARWHSLCWYVMDVNIHNSLKNISYVTLKDHSSMPNVTK